MQLHLTNRSILKYHDCKLMRFRVISLSLKVNTANRSTFGFQFRH